MRHKHAEHAWIPNQSCLCILLGILSTETLLDQIEPMGTLRRHIFAVVSTHLQAKATAELHHHTHLLCVLQATWQRCKKL